MTTTYPITPRTKMKRGHQRAEYDVDLVNSILDEAYICHVGAKMADRPMVQPTVHWRVDDKLYIHGSSKNGLFQTLINGEEACITVTLLDGLVMARSSFHHSANYRSVMIFSKATLINDDTEALHLLDLMMKKITPDRFDGIRGPNPQELKATSVLQFDLKEVSAKVRTGPPVDDEEDYALPVWAGVIPLTLEVGKHVDDPRWVEDHGATD
ncbi:pyridoxamine 5'-phosphate oxidase family protein [Terasakiella sp. A23]|uniref:pyridoxamine 5'-phosphate oxidase family protein n=1 Tax=Terasakiella sp. FCG-A23 TaxID=3080561 RepID=UPI00295304C0|nr:pyridoxamine 5'-phosphate oxidase family protein [Terasakiella sp. A23]MDV7340277.1 pyridoxamine 5'-phosphate oxidase family protein [Terasakiella sp. A23]